MKAHLKGDGQNGHAEAASANGVNRQAGGGVLTPEPLEPSATAPGEAPKPATEGRDAGGKFAVGNRLGKGNPHARRMAALRQAFLSVATEERLKELGEQLYAAAVRDDWQAAKLFLLFVVGRPAGAVDPDALDRDEWQQSQEWPHQADVFAALGKVVFGDALRMMQNLAPSIVPMFSEEAKRDSGSSNRMEPGRSPTGDQAAGQNVGNAPLSGQA
jgi:hypothetical protein